VTELPRVANSRMREFQEIIVQIVVRIFLVLTSFRANLGSIKVPIEISEWESGHTKFNS